MKEIICFKSTGTSFIYAPVYEMPDGTIEVHTVDYFKCDGVGNHGRDEVSFTNLIDAMEYSAKMFNDWQIWTT